MVGVIDGGAGLELRLQAADQTSDQSVEAAERLREEMQTIRKQQVRSRCHQMESRNACVCRPLNWFIPTYTVTS